MYNKLFTKILDSSVWLTPDTTRLVWITMLACMDEDGFVALKTPQNVANRALISLPAAISALHTLESEDPEDSTCRFHGRRLERVPDGWMVLKAEEYREIVTRSIRQSRTRERVQRFRERCNASVTPSNDCVTPSVSVSVSEAETLNPPRAARVSPPLKKSAKEVPESWEPGAALLAKIEAEDIEKCLTRGGTTVAMELERFRSCTFATLRSDWDKTAWNWLLTECKKINQKEVMYVDKRQANRR